MIKHNLLSNTNNIANKINFKPYSLNKKKSFQQYKLKNFKLN